MRPVLHGTLCALAVSFAASVASAQVDAERFKPAVTHDGFVTAEGSAVRPTADPFELALFANYARDPLIVVDDSGDKVGAFVEGRMGFDVIASMTLVGPLAVGVDMPLYALQSGDGDPSSAGLGKLRVVPKIADPRRPRERGFGACDGAARSHQHR